jgi:hypothetical protein
VGPWSPWFRDVGAGGQAERLGCRSSIRPPGWGMVMYGRGRVGSIRGGRIPVIVATLDGLVFVAGDNFP